MSEFAELLQKELALIDGAPVLQAPQVARLEAHYDLLIRWNSKMNLTAIRSLGDSVKRHYVECLCFSAWLRADSGSGILDVGSGAGFPGIPMAILREDWKVTLLESDQRKAVFLREASRELPNVSVFCERLERLAGSWGWLVSRAVKPSEVVAAIPRLAPCVGLMVGEDAVKGLDSSVSWNTPRPLPFGDHMVMVTGVSP
jgi:16S rRNA (guanine527-N7)-methyltransferase